MNVLVISGNLGQDAESGTAGSTATLKFSVPMKSGYGDRQKTSWVRCTLWGKRAEGGLVNHLTKGTPVCVSGELSENTWTAQDGTEKHSLELNVNDVTLMGKGNERQEQPASQPDDPGLDDEISF